MVHKTVLLQEAISGLEIKSGDVFFDGTLGGGGHSEAVFGTWGSSVKVIAADLDEDAIARATERISKIKNDFTAYRSNFRNVDQVLDRAGVQNADRILLDLGLSSNQFEDSGRGFTFQKDEPLLMTFKKELGEEDITAREIVNTWNEEHIVDILRGYGEEQFAEKIAKKICDEREKKPIETTFDLVRVVEEATPVWYHKRKIHPATKTFQALRITVNDEIRSLEEGLKKGFERLNPGGRMAIISFHSMEDRIVKNFFRDKAKEGLAKIITKKPIVPSKEEVQENRRSRSAKLRIIQKN